MATKAKNVYTPRFDFGSNLDPDGKQMSTIKELLAEINYENGKTIEGGDGEAKESSEDGAHATFKSLSITLGFIKQITGKAPSTITEKLPLSTLKIIKLLYVANDNSDIQMFNLMGPPIPGDETTTMEFNTTSTIARGKRGAAVIHSVAERLASEINPEKRQAFDRLMLSSETLNAHIECTNDEINQHLSRQFACDDPGLAMAWRQLTKLVDETRYIKTSTPAPMNEAIFAHLRSLGFVHFALHHRTFIDDIWVKNPLRSITDPAIALCQKLKAMNEGVVLPHEKFRSVNDFDQLVTNYLKDFTSLVKAATGLDTRKYRMLENIRPAKRILSSYGHRCYNETNLDAPVLSILDIVAALCSIRYQQDVKTEYTPYWMGQASQGKDPQRHFDSKQDPDDPFQHQGVIQIYLYRFQEYLSAFTGTVDSFHAWMGFQVARFDAYARILQLNDISAIIASVNHLDEYCSHHAMAISGKSLNTVQ